MSWALAHGLWLQNQKIMNFCNKYNRINRLFKKELIYGNSLIFDMFMNII